MSFRAALTCMVVASGVAAAGAAGSVRAQLLPAENLVSTLREGGYVIVMRHASSPREAPDANEANLDNADRERQLDDTGRRTSEMMGRTIRTLKIPVGPVLSSPTYRARETANLAGFEDLQVHAELGDRGRSMQGVTEVDARWLRERTARAVAGSNVLIVTHRPNISGAFPDVDPGPEDGESLVFKPDGEGRMALVGRISIKDWPDLN